MKILNICLSSPFTEGYSYQDNLLSEYQAKLGHEVTVLTATRTRNAEGKIIETSPGEKVLENGVRLIRIKFPGKLHAFFGIFPGVKKVIEAVAPDFIFIHGLATFAPQSAAAYKRRHPQVVIVADNHQDNGTTYTDKFPFNIQIGIFRSMWKKWIGHVDKVYGTTSWRKSFAHKYYGIPEEKLDVLIMGIDSDRMPADHERVREEVRAELSISDDAFVFVTGGKLDPRKKTLELMRAFTSLAEEKAVLLIFGSVREDIKPEFEQLTARDGRIRYIGYVDSKTVHRYFIASDFGLFPGRHSVLWEEAIGCGLPCIFHKYEEKDHTDVCGNCVRVENPDESELAEIMNRVVSDVSYYDSLKRNTQEASKTFSYRSIAGKSLESVKHE